MPRNTGRNNRDREESVSNITESLADHLYPTDRTNVRCRMCSMMVPDIPLHLSQIHINTSLQEYRVEFPDAPIIGEPQQENRQQGPVRVSAKEAASHPGGRDAAYNEKMLDVAERTAYREDVVRLINEKGYQPGYQVASVAYQMALARRVRIQIEDVRKRAKGQVIDSQNLRTLQEIEKVISGNLADLEKARLSRVNDEDPLKVHEEEIEEAEAWLIRHQGEFVEQCGNCNAPLTAPNVPHWAFAPIRTSRGVEWPVWSHELWRLVRAGALPLWVMAYVLRTSPEGLRWTCQRRGEPWLEQVDIEREERVLRRILETHDVQGSPVPSEDVAAVSAAVQAIALEEESVAVPTGTNAQ